MWGRNWTALIGMDILGDYRLSFVGNRLLVDDGDVPEDGFVALTTDSFMVIPVLSKDMEQIMDAQRARGLVTEGNLMTRMKAFVPVIVPVVANAFAKVQDQAIAMDTKGFNSKTKKTIYRELPNTNEDKIVKAISLVVLVASIVYAFLKK